MTFSAVCFSRFLSHLPYNYTNAFEALKLRTLQVIRRHFNTPFLSSKRCPSLTDNISLRFSSHNIRNFSHFSVARTNCRPARRATAANLIRQARYRHAVSQLEVRNRFYARCI